MPTLRKALALDLQRRSARTAWSGLIKIRKRAPPLREKTQTCCLPSNRQLHERGLERLPRRTKQREHLVD